MKIIAPKYKKVFNPTTTFQFGSRTMQFRGNVEDRSGMHLNEPLVHVEFETDEEVDAIILGFQTVRSTPKLEECWTCGGVKLISDQVCICGDTGLHSQEVQNMREECLKLREENYELKSERSKLKNQIRDIRIASGGATEENINPDGRMLSRGIMSEY